MLDENTATPEFDLESTKPAGFWIRVAAALIDMLIMMVFIIGAMFMKSVAGYLLISILTLLYKPLLEGTLGGTAGKLALGLKVVNRDGEILGIAGATVRAGLFIVASITNILLQTKMIQQGISQFDPVAVSAFQQAHMVLYGANIVLSIVALISCIVVAFTARKRGLHDMIADSFVIYKDVKAGSNEG